MALVDLKNVIEHWESVLFHDKFLMSPATQALVEATVQHLKDYDKILKGGQNVALPK